MLVIRPAELEGTAREIPFGPDAQALTYLTSAEGTGCGFGVVALATDVATEFMTYRHHVKMNYVLQGSGTIMNEDGEKLAAQAKLVLLRGRSSRSSTPRSTKAHRMAPTGFPNPARCRTNGSLVAAPCSCVSPRTLKRRS